MTNDLISRSALLAEYDRAHVGEPGGARKLIEEAPAVDAEPVRHAEWIPWEINGKETKLFMTCSGCRRYQWPRNEVPLFRYCPKCGAKMDGGATHD